MTHQRPTNKTPADSPVLPDGSTSSVAETETSAFTIVCAWCGAIKAEGQERTVSARLVRWN